MLFLRIISLHINDSLQESTEGLVHQPSSADQTIVTSAIPVSSNLYIPGLPSISSAATSVVSISTTLSVPGTTPATQYS